MTESPREPRVWTFPSTWDAYNATQCNEEIRDGDVLVIEPERAIGIAWTWPFALTEAIGELHITLENPRTREGGIFAAGVDRAEQLAGEFGWPIVPPLDLAYARALLAAHSKCGEPLGFKVLTQRTETSRERTGWLVAGTTGFVQLDTHGHLDFAAEWVSLTNDQEV